MDYGPNRTAPHALEAEEAVLGCVLINSDALYEAATFLKAKDFYLHKHRWIWDAYASLNNARMPLDIVTVANELERHNQLGEVGGTAYLTRLINAVPTSLNAEAYARLVKTESVRRDLLEAATAIAQTAYDEGKDIEALTQESHRILLAATEYALPNDPKPLSQVASEYYDRLRELCANPENFRGVPTGLIDLDRKLGGLRADELIIIAGRPGTGKTAEMLTIARNAAELGKRIVMFSLEMGNHQIAERLVALEGNVHAEHLHRGALVDDDWDRVTQAIGRLSDYGVVLDDTPGITIAGLRAKCSKLHMEDELDLIIVDYLQLMQGGGRRYSNRVEEMSEISRGLKILAKELHVPVLAGAQLNREVEKRDGKRPVLSDLRESGSIEQDSDIVIFIHPEDETAPIDVTTNIIAKHRSGEVGDVPMIFDKTRTAFRNKAVDDVTGYR